ncbi:hypothetical protein V5P93_002672 [Actinokineospora auranticolor]|uniref:Putative lipoprotein with Yx(FWY)xxD motif n=1 Tax=Actinokineospora auranticolor TaxID=155976 RepID=A0A2S6GM28_9PSEU|nr:hypothetical protein [Actinokineospora auranticolor]PPK66299.1 putative lipoprotein with Yx(FWY)xxD motif [Actinokineospora auranticolor]
MNRRSALAVSLLAAGAVLTACGDAQLPGTADVKPASVQVGGDAKAVDSVATALTDAIRAMPSPEFGKLVVDGDGRTIYRFDKDTAKPPTTNCTGDCAAAWPPVLVDDPAAVQATGVDATLLGTVERPEGGKQLTIAGWPAYRYAKDTAPGDVKGQGAGGNWFAFTPEGKKAAAAKSGTVGVAVMKVGKLGQIVTDREGMTLYRFDKDSAKPPTTNCKGDCAKKWPPVLVPDGAKVEGLDSLGTVDRGDGTRQLTVGGWPVYRFAEDKVPCDTKGQGVGGTWFALNDTGAKVGA